MTVRKSKDHHVRGDKDSGISLTEEEVEHELGVSGEKMASWLVVEG